MLRSIVMTMVILTLYGFSNKKPQSEVFLVPFKFYSIDFFPGFKSDLDSFAHSVVKYSDRFNFVFSVSPSNSYFEYQIDTLIGFKRFRALVSFMKDSYGMNERMFLFRDIKYTKVNDGGETGLVISVVSY